MRKCGRCDLVKSRSEFYGAQTKRQSTCKTCIKRRHFENKIEKLNAYGGCRCTCCGEKLLEFLTLDHIGNSKREIKSKMSRGLRTMGFPYKNKIRVLCMNCNFAYGIFGYCPHKVSEVADPIGRILSNINRNGHIKLVIK